ncbi:MAG: flavodoxin domain-containing protein [Anaerolineaceae bacterium]|nr:flavodoxin domain-containing protein [Anaerolineaceae bacterium]
MEKKVLVAYGSKHGSTAEIAEKIAQVIRDAGFDVDVSTAKAVQNLASYQAVILGSGVYIGQWVKEAVKFVKENESVLSNLPVWIFSTGPTGEGDASELVQGWKLPRGIQECMDRIQPKGVVVFHGAIDTNKLSFLEKWMIGRVGAAMGDFRDWEKISNWAVGVATQLKE